MIPCPIKLTPPWGKNYCRTWIFYHLTVWFFGTLCMRLFVGGWMAAFVIVSAGTIAGGIINFLIDRNCKNVLR